jgi:acyl-CoA synthetase (AMP-forming)/AMP-acid ligase II
VQAKQAGLPKGVPLSHRNLVTNILRLSETGFVAKDDRLPTALPLFDLRGSEGRFFWQSDAESTRLASISAQQTAKCHPRSLGSSQKQLATAPILETNPSSMMTFAPLG